MHVGTLRGVGTTVGVVLPVRCLALVTLLLGLSGEARADFLTTNAAALDWLVGEQSESGSWGASTTRAIYTQEAVDAFYRSNRAHSEYHRGIAWLENHAMLNTDDRARRVLALAVRGDRVDEDLAALDAAQRPDPTGSVGWGLSPGYEGEVLDSAMALRAYAAAGSSASIDPGAQFLVDRQLADGGWNDHGPTSDPATTAQAVRALVALRGQTSIAIEPAIAAGVGNLSALVGSTSLPIDRGLAAVTYYSEGGAASLVAAAALLGGLESDQAANGSWDDDALATAIVAQAFAAGAGLDAPGLLQAVPIEDHLLRKQLNALLGKNASDAITVSDMTSFGALDLAGIGIRNLSGIESAVNATSIDLRNNALIDVSLLDALIGVTPIYLYGNPALGARCDVDDSGDLGPPDVVVGSQLLDGSRPLTAAELARMDVMPQPSEGDGLIRVDDFLMILRSVGETTVTACGP